MSMNRVRNTVYLCLSILIVLACNLGTSPTLGAPDPSMAETEVQLRVVATSQAIQQMTLDAAQLQVAQPVSTEEPTQTSLPVSLPTETIPPTPIPTQTQVPSPASLVLDIQTSVDEFYCYQPPYELTISVTVSDIERGMSVYYHISDKNSGVSSEWQTIDLHRRTSTTRDATIIGGGSSRQNLQFPPLMGESWFIYQIISDDGKFRSPSYGNITFFPCGQ
jgi:hypothetical protein